MVDLSGELTQALEEQELERQFETREPKSGDLVFVEGIPGILFQVNAVYCITKLISLHPLSRSGFGFKRMVLPASVLRFPHPARWYEVAWMQISQLWRTRHIRKKVRRSR